MPDLDAALFDRSPSAVVVLNRHGQVIRVNREARRGLGVDADGVLGRPVLGVVAPDDRPRTKQAFLRVLGGQEREWMARVLRGDGSTRSQWIRAVPLEEGGRVRGIVMFMRDASEPAGGRPEARQMQTLLENLPGQFVAVLDASGVIRYASRLSRTHFRDDVDAVGTPYRDLLEDGEDNRLLLDRLLQDTAEGRDWGGTQWHVRADGAPFPVLTVASPYRDARGGRVLGALVVGRDLSTEHRWRLRAQESERLAAVGRMVAGAAAEVGGAAARLASAWDAPAAWDGEPAAAAVEEVARISSLARALERLAGAGWGERPERLSLAEEVAGVLDGMARARGVAVEMEAPSEPVVVHGHREPLAALVRELVDNAVESAPAGADARVRLSFGATADGRRVRMSVSDTGVGIPQEALHRVTDPFFSTKPGHAGLGLALARAVAAGHGGGLTVESPGPGKGTTVVVELPREAPGTTVRFRPVPLTLRRSRSVLIVDDEPTVRLSVRRFLERVGYEVREAWSGRSALAQVTAGTPPEMVLTDLRMADGSGAWLVEQLARDFPDLLRRTVIVTGATEEDELSALTRRTGCPLLRKPLEMPQLLDVLDEVAARE